MGSFASIYDNVLKDCNFSPQRIDSTAYFINYDDIMYVEFDGYSPQTDRTVPENKDVIKLYLKPGTYAYTFSTKNDAISSGFYEYELLYSDVFAHWVEIKIFGSDYDLKSRLEILPKGKYVVIVNGEIYGLYSGLVLNEKEKNSSDDNQYTYFFLNFESDVSAVEHHAPHKFLGDIDWLQRDHWILWDGWWDDSGIWIDTEIWNEG